MDTNSMEEDRRLGLNERIVDLVANATEFNGEIYRSASPKYATSRDLVTGDGAKQFGGRWNPAGIAAVCEIFARLVPMSTRSLASIEAGKQPSASVLRHLRELKRVVDALSEVIQRCDWALDERAE